MFGPVSAGIIFSENMFHYSYGTFIDNSCGKSQSLNHSVVLVGYGTDSNGQDCMCNLIDYDILFIFSLIIRQKNSIFFGQQEKNYKFKFYVNIFHIFECL